MYCCRALHIDAADIIQWSTIRYMSHTMDLFDNGTFQPFCPLIMTGYFWLSKVIL